MQLIFETFLTYYLQLNFDLSVFTLEKPGVCLDGISACFIIIHSTFGVCHFELTGVHNAPDGAELCDVAPHLSEVPVLSWPEVQHPASEAGLLEHQPVTVHHVAGLTVRHVKTIHYVVAVVAQLVHLASEVLPLVDPHSEGASVLWMKKQDDCGL